MGAVGITMATRFLCTVEAPIQHAIKEHMAREDVDERSTTVVLSKLNNATRVIRNDVSLKMLELEQEPELSFDQLAPLARYSCTTIRIVVVNFKLSFATAAREQRKCGKKPVTGTTRCGHAGNP